MAELQRYNPVGIGLASLPGLPTVEPVALQESIRQTQGMQQSLDRISQFAFREAEEEAKRKGQLYGIQNPPKAADVAKALDAGNLDSVLQPTGTAFGNAANRVQATSLRLELENRTRLTLSEISKDVDAGKITDPNDVLTRINSQIDGYTKVLGQISAEDALHYRSTSFIAGNAVYNKAAAHIEKFAIEVKKQDAEEAIVNSTRLISDAMIATQDPDMLALSIKNERDRIKNQAIATRDPLFYRATMDTLDKNLVATLASHLMRPETGLGSPDKVLQAIDSGQLGNVSGVAKLVDKLALKTEFIKALTTQVTIKNSLENLEKEKNKDLAIGVWDDFYKGKSTKDQTISKLREINLITPAELYAIKNYEFDTNKANDRVFGDFQSQADRGILGENDLKEAAINGKISWKQHNELAKIVRNKENDLSKARIVINGTLGVMDWRDPTIKPETIRRAAEANVALVSAYEAARAAGIAFNPHAAALAAVEGTRNKVKEESMAQGEKDMKKLLESANVEFNPRSKYTEEFLLPLVKDQKKRKDILDAQKRMRGE